MSIVRFCNAAGCRETVPVGTYYCKRHQYLQKEWEERHKSHRKNTAGMTDEQRHQYNKRVYARRMAASAKAPHDYNRFYKTRAWRRLSRLTLERRPVCVSCLRKGIIKKADVVDHIVPIRENWNVRLDPNNLQPLCHHCHRLKTKRDHQREKQNIN